MIDYRAGTWGFHVSLGWQGSLAPRALTMAVPNAIITFIISTYFVHHTKELADQDGASVQMVIAAFEVVMIFILYNRSRTSYNRWWEGGTLLQKTRGEWFNAYSSIMAFTSTRPEMQEQVEAYTHGLARLMSLLMCCGLQQVSPQRDRPFSILDLEGMAPESMEYLNGAPDKVEVILQWVQRSMVLHMQTGVLPVAPPILSRAFQEISRGIVNLQNARKIADFPYPYPLAQVSMILQLLHWAMIPIAAPMVMSRAWAVLYSFFSIFVLWCIHFNALDLEFPFGDRVNDLPMHDMQQDWNNSICALLDKRASQPPTFEYDPTVHNEIKIAMSDASPLYVPTKAIASKGTAVIKVASMSAKRRSDIGSIDASSADMAHRNSADVAHDAKEEQVTKNSPIAGEEGLSTSSRLSTIKSFDRAAWKQSFPNDTDMEKPAPPHLDKSLATIAGSLEMQANELPKMASPVFLKHAEKHIEKSMIVSQDAVTLHPALDGRILEETASDSSMVTISLQNLYI